VSGARDICPGPFRTLDEAKKHGLVFDVPRRHCRWCGAACAGRRSSFCSGAPANVKRGQVSVAGSGCVHEWMLRSSPSYLREEVFRRDRGVCAACGLDTVMLHEAIWRLPTDVELADRCGLLVSRESILGALGFAPRDAFCRTLWEADHVVLVEKGGGLCGLDGMQTLCAPCHRRKSARERRRAS
jgi:5-methylcytosine-specific restriction protein A